MSFFEKSLSTLELPAVLKMLSEQAVSAPAKEECPFPQAFNGTG